MREQQAMPDSLQKILVKATTLNGPQLVNLAQNPLVRKTVTRQVEKQLMQWLKNSRSNPEFLPGVEDDRIAIGLGIMGSIDRALANRALSPATIHAILELLVQGLLFNHGDETAAQRFEKEYGQKPPTFLLLSPSKACNLRCTGCYADSTDQPQSLDWDTVDRMISEAKSLWGARFFVFSGGEPFAYRSGGKGIVDLIEKHSDCFFMAYTNGTLITDEISQRLSRDGNMLLCISVEGWKQRTDERRGAGVFDRIIETMDRLHQDGVPFGISLTGTRYNVEEILSDEFIDFFISKGVLFAWLFQYMPIGRGFTLDLMVTPEQRTWMWRRSWEIVREKKFFLADFWNSGTACDGCLSAGGHGHGGYFYVDWNGAVSPCVFLPFSPVNIKDIYVRGGNLNDAWKEPFFHAIRDWQHAYSNSHRNGIAPCPNRDHHDELEQLIRQFEPEPIDQNAAETLRDPSYSRGLRDYDRKFAALTQEIWKRHYIEGEDGKGDSIAPLPEVPHFSEIKPVEISETELVK